jgi:hypothetical protein
MIYHPKNLQASAKRLKQSYTSASMMKSKFSSFTDYPTLKAHKFDYTYKPVKKIHCPVESYCVTSATSLH